MSESPDLQIIDVRRPGEFAAGHLPGALGISLQEIESLRSRVDTSRPAAVICAGGYRSSIGASTWYRIQIRPARCRSISTVNSSTSLAGVSG